MNNKFWWLFAVLSAGLITLFWGIWYFITGGIPAVTKVILTESYVLELSISRWWDALLGPIIIAAFAVIHTNQQLGKKDKLWLAADFTAGFIAGIVGASSDLGLIFLLVGVLAAAFSTVILQLHRYADIPPIIVGLILGASLFYGATIAALCVIPLVAGVMMPMTYRPDNLKPKKGLRSSA